ncbi:DHC_N1 domain-containing protein [Caenorhabditis elegans]|uniref:DHC_N1 domain-containing protein n=1 Tax=Caenorhabditis elegans TaxID=6239 RepID=Q22654_CAEEL|nr:DHC_N1 domain-containing protein [Caenorhabditis elegans]CAA94218.1 DHC_N1 domain-containing protein [Caenorhabditis elegans]|eukprot:NP_509815.1 Uncharacterized protein CELE_T21E8.5 [Caenorhabditis elegans]
MKVAPLLEEVMDLRRKIHIINAEQFLKTRNEHTTLILQVEAMITEFSLHVFKEHFEAIRRKGAYCSVRGERNFVRYSKTLTELNSSLRHMIASFHGNN